jgi:ATP-dependent RNA helicase HelY
MRFRLPEIPPPQILAALRDYNLLPAIIFMPTRRRCDESAMEVALKKQHTNLEKAEARRQLFQEYVEQNPEIKNHKHRKVLLNAGVAAHHAGHIPAWKLLVEKMMSAGLLEAIFATSTVAAGVDFPARTVVLSNADARGNDGWRPIQASELQQMTGRAGRRGKDNVGFVVLAPSNYQNPPRIAELLKSPPDALQSQFRATYSSLLNLLDAYKSFSQVREIAEKSFAFRETAAQIARMERKRDKRLDEIQRKLDKSNLKLKTDDVLAFQILTNVRNRLQENSNVTRAEVRHNWLAENVQSGRIISQGRSGKRFFLVLNVHGEKVSAMRDDGSGTTFALSRVNRVYAKKYPLVENSVELAFDEIHEGKNPPLNEPRLPNRNAESDEAVEIVNQTIERLLPDGTSETERLHATSLFWETWNDADFLQKTERDVEILRDEVWSPFEHRAKVLHHFGYLDYPLQTVTESGKWLADLRVDRPLLVGEALKHKLFEKLEPKHVAGMMAALAADSDRNYGELYLSDKILDTLSEFEEIVFQVSNVEWKYGVEPAPEMNFSAAAAAEEWANGMKWEDLVYETKAEEGDLVRLLSRTGEALLQIANLKKSNPEAAEIARQTAEIILREPIR